MLGGVQGNDPQRGEQTHNIPARQGEEYQMGQGEDYQMGSPIDHPHHFLHNNFPSKPFPCSTDLIAIALATLCLLEFKLSENTKLLQEPLASHLLCLLELVPPITGVGNMNHELWAPKKTYVDWGTQTPQPKAKIEWATETNASEGTANTGEVTNGGKVTNAGQGTQTPVSRSPQPILDLSDLSGFPYEPRTPPYCGRRTSRFFPSPSAVKEGSTTSITADEPASRSPQALPDLSDLAGFRYEPSTPPYRGRRTSRFFPSPSPAEEAPTTGTAADEDIATRADEKVYTSADEQVPTTSTTPEKLVVPYSLRSRYVSGDRAQPNTAGVWNIPHMTEEQIVEAERDVAQWPTPAQATDAPKRASQGAVEPVTPPPKSKKGGQGSKIDLSK
ncbi:hypothetical protein EJ06DRAFT_545636 [Trichodelitschia bisporula]|uniref:Uncharacterized protein n=1 Tax=Trichodelitschia bisporula TaxID=703511 RepID=A0A6G1I9Q0_9PEZI|nr:hypothetical protein EJ06DRAFT_545636 [Trichodelitschia bisporula]